MGKRSRISYIVVLAVVAVFVALAGYAQEDIKTVDDPAFKTRMRPPVSFLHDRHNEKAGIDDCQTCHHVYKGGKKVDGSSEDKQCSECHMKEGDPMPLIEAFHKQCKGCHAERKVGPVMCAECHLQQ